MHLFNMCSWSSCSVHVTVIKPLAVIFDILNQKWCKVHRNCLGTDQDYEGDAVAVAAAADDDETKETRLLIDVSLYNTR
jgi:hypothetical protein